MTDWKFLGAINKISLDYKFFWALFNFLNSPLPLLPKKQNSDVILVAGWLDKSQHNIFGSGERAVNDKDHLLAKGWTVPRNLVLKSLPIAFQHLCWFAASWDTSKALWRVYWYNLCFKIHYTGLSTKRVHCYHMLDQETEMLKSQQLLLLVYGQLMKRMAKWLSTMMNLKWSSWIARFVSVKLPYFLKLNSWHLHGAANVIIQTQETMFHLITKQLVHLFEKLHQLVTWKLKIW